MKKTLLTLTLLFITTTLYSQSITIGDDGIVRCKGVSIGTTQTIFGDTYEVVDRDLLIQRRNEGKDLTKVCVSNVTDMSEMFRERQFNQNISNWDVSSVTDMSGMFYNSQFNQPIGNWDVSSVTSMSQLFTHSQFNQPIGNWDVGSVKNIESMFWESQFNQPIGDWDVSNVTNMRSIFFGSSFNQPLGNWDVSNVTNMRTMFQNTPFNQPIGNWDVSSVTDMGGMFNNSQFNQPIEDWDVSSVTDMGGMFRDSQFNQPIGDWDVSNVTSMEFMFHKTPFNQPIGDWNVGNARNMSWMFGGTPFNQPIGDWDVSSVTRLNAMFWESQFNQPIGNWDVSSVTDMSGMFYNSPFNQPVNLWCVINITSEPNGFSTNSPLSPQNKPVWGTCIVSEKLTQLLPLNNSILPSNRIEFIWQKGDSKLPPTQYQLQVFEGWFDPIVIDTLVSDTTLVIVNLLSSNTEYYWRVRGVTDELKPTRFGVWSSVWKVTTLRDDGIVRCKGISIGTMQTILGEVYEVVDRNLLIQRRDEGKDLTKVCVSNVTDMSGMFQNQQFNQNISTWDVSSVTNMANMFRGQSTNINPFNQPIGDWDVGKVTNMRSMFLLSEFNQPIGDWDVSWVTNMSSMFSGSPFNQPIGDWDVSSVTNMRSMFRESKFNYPIEDWEVSSVMNMGNMFLLSEFNQPIGNWNVSSVTDMSSMFFESQFNQPIGNWDVSSVTNMSGMFYNSQFNQPIGNWDVSKVRVMEHMFWNSKFNQPIGDWDVSSVTNMSSMFLATPFNQPIGDWDVSKVTSMTQMFTSTPFNQPIGDWDVSKVTDMSRMFRDSQFNQHIGTWDVSSVIDMESMFSESQFNQLINLWCVTKITSEPNGFSTNSPLSPQNKPVWGTCIVSEKLTQLLPLNNSILPSNRIEFIWQKGDSQLPPTKYQLQVIKGFDPIVIDTLVSDTTLVIVNLLNSNTEYFWRVRGVNDELNPIRFSEWSSGWKFTTEAGPVGMITLLTPQDNTTVETLTPSLIWKKESNSQSYRVQVSTNNFSTFVVNNVVTDTTFTTPQLSYNTQYQWRVRGTNTSGNGEWSTVWKFTTQVGNITLVLPENNSTDVSRNVELRWIKDTQSTKYQLQVSEGFNPTVIDTLVSDTTYTHIYPFKDNFVYNWRVRGYNETINRYGEWSSIWKFTTLLDTSLPTEELPTQFSLQQNYPNPFNPTTQIGFSLPQSTHVRLEVFSITGQSVTVLKDESMSIGNHTVTFNGSNLSSGVYIYRLTTPEYTQTRLMNLIK